MPEMFNPFEGLTEEQIARVQRAGEIGMAKMKNENMPFAFALFHPDVLDALRGETPEKEK